MDHFAGLDVSVKETSICIVDDTGRIVREVKVASEPEALLKGSGEPDLPLQADRTGSRAVIAMAVQRSGRSRVTSGLCRDAAHAGGAEGADQQDRSQRCARHRPDDTGGALPSGACEDATQSETADAADPSQASAVQGDCHRERSARYVAQLRPHVLAAPLSEMPETDA